MTSHEIVVRATSTDGSTSDDTFVIAVMDVDEVNIGPVSDTDPSAAVLAEDAPVGSSAGIAASAADADVGDSVTYSLADDAGGLFAIDSASGIVTLAGALDAETSISHEIMVRATSTDGSTSERAFAIAVTDVDETDVGSVEDTDPAASVLVEDATPGAPSGITASAADADIDDSVSYELVDDANGLFAIDATSGTVALAGALDAETATSHEITVRATSTDGSVSERAFAIAVTDVDEVDVGPMEDVDPAASVLAEDTAAGSSVGIAASAEDADIDDSVSYELVDDANGPFAIDEANGVVTLAGALDAETSVSHEIMVRATSTDGSTSESTFAIAVTDVDEVDVGPVKDADPSPSVLAEDVAPGVAAGIIASAEDADVDDSVSYELVDDANGLFAIDAASGIVTLAGALDAETSTSHEIAVRATSSDGSTSEAAFTVGVDDVNEAPTLADARFETVAGYAGPIGTLEAVDPDSGDVLVFELLSTGTASGLGVELGADGAVRVAASAPGEHVLDVQVVDAGGASAAGTLTIGVGPAPVEPPLTEAEPVPVDPVPAEPEPSDSAPVDPTPAEPDPAGPELAAASPTEPEPEPPAPRPSFFAPPSSAPAVPGGTGADPATRPLAGVPSASEGPVPSAPNAPDAAEPGDPGPGERVAASRERIGGVVGGASAESRPVRVVASAALGPVARDGRGRRPRGRLGGARSVGGTAPRRAPDRARAAARRRRGGRRRRPFGGVGVRGAERAGRAVGAADPRARAAALGRGRRRGGRGGARDARRGRRGRDGRHARRGLRDVAAALGAAAGGRGGGGAAVARFRPGADPRRDAPVRRRPGRCLAARGASPVSGPVARPRTRLRRLRDDLAGRSQPFRLGLALVMLSLSVLFAADVLGLRPDPDEAVRESRKSVAESLAIQLSALASVGGVGDVEYAVSAFTLRTPDVRAAELAREGGAVIARHGDVDALTAVAERSSATHLSVPILEDGSPWGWVRVVFAPTNGAARELAWLAFVGLASLASFALFLGRVLVQLDPGRVVPERVDSAFDLFSAGVVILDARGRIVMANRAAEALAGGAADALLGRTLDEWAWQDGPDGPDGPGARPWAAALANARPEPDRRMRLRGEDGAVRALSVSCAPVGDGPQGVLVTLDDETLVERQNRDLEAMLVEARRLRDEVDAKNRELEVLATTDPLTGIANRRVLMERLDAALARARRDGTPLACVMCDVDHFKRVNDTWGHGVGDDVIRAVARTLTETCGAGATVGRYGGEEFVAVLPGRDAGAAALLAERVRIAVIALAGGDALPVPSLSASFGVAGVAPAIGGVPGDVLEGVPGDAGALVDAADRALYAAKGGGRNRVVVAGREEPDVDGARVPGASPGAADAAVETGVGARADAEAGTATGADTGVDTGVDTGARDADVRPSVSDLARARVLELEAELERHRAHLAALREFDALTGVPMRTLFLRRVEAELDRASRSGALVGALSFELRELERLVSTFGHAACDALVVELVARLERSLRATDLVSEISAEHSLSRITSNEFGVLLCDLPDPAGALVVVARLRRTLGEPFLVAGDRVYLGVNIGIALSGPNGEGRPAELLGQAGDARVAAAERPEKVSHAFASAALDARAHDYIRLESDLHEALENGDLEVWFQPKFDLARRAVTGMEALVRWRHETRGFVSPAVFVAVAEANGLIGRLSDFVLASTLGRIALWRSMGFDELRVSINVSPMQLHAESLVDDLLAALDRAGVEGRQLEVELTETSVFERPEEARAALGALRAAGVGVSMDDFGTGYTSLALLADLPLDTVKIDRSFVVAMEASERSRSIVASVITMAHALGLRVVGEGIETEAQLDALATLGCDDVQGYLISRPMPADEMTAFLVRERDAGRARRA